MIDLSVLNVKDKIEIDEYYSFDTSYFEDTVIKKLDNVHAEGYFYLNASEEYAANIDISGVMILPDSVTMEDINYEFSCNIDDVIDNSCIKNQNMLDIMEFLWQNIVLEVPIRYTKSDADNLKGENWSVINNNEDTNEIDPRMQKLYDYYNKGGE